MGFFSFLEWKETSKLCVTNSGKKHYKNSSKNKFMLKYKEIQKLKGGFGCGRNSFSCDGITRVLVQH